MKLTKSNNSNLHSYEFTYNETKHNIESKINRIGYHTTTNFIEKKIQHGDVCETELLPRIKYFCLSMAKLRCYSSRKANVFGVGK